jgi:hypothetical protein
MLCWRSLDTQIEIVNVRAVGGGELTNGQPAGSRAHRLRPDMFKTSHMLGQPFGAPDGVVIRSGGRSDTHCKTQRCQITAVVGVPM